MSENKSSLRKAFKEFVWPRRKIILLGFLLIVIGRVASLLVPWQTQILVDDVAFNKDYQLLQQVLIITLLSITTQAVISFALVRLLGIEAQRLIKNLRVRVQKHILSLPIRFYDNNKSGKLVSRVMTDVEGVRNLVGTGLVQLVGGTITAIGSIFILASINWRMTVYAVIPIVIFAIIMLKAFAFIRPIFRDRTKIRAEVTGRLTETLGGIRMIKGFNAEKPENTIFKAGVDRLFKNIKKSMTATALVSSSTTLLVGITTVIVMKVGGSDMITGDMTTGQFIQFIMLLGFMVAPIIQMSNIGTQLTEALAGLDRTEELLEEAPENNLAERTTQINDVVGDMQFKNVSFSYEEDKEVVHDISFDAPLGSVTALVGTSGSGKSTIAGLAASFMQPDSGQVLIDGQDLSKIDLDSYRQFLGVVLQDDFLFEGSIRENILFPRPGASEEELENAVKAAYVDEFANDFDEGLDTLIGERGVKLSGGQRQRIAIARAILADPKIIILDEATSNLDNESEAFIQKSLAKLMEGRTTFVIAHRLSTIRKADQILVIEKGKIAEQGTHDQLIEEEGRYYDLHTYQSRI